MPPKGGRSALLVKRASEVRYLAIWRAGVFETRRLFFTLYLNNDHHQVADPLDGLLDRLSFKPISREGGHHPTGKVDDPTLPSSDSAPCGIDQNHKAIAETEPCSSSIGGADTMQLSMQHYSSAAALPAGLSQWAFDLVKSSLGHLYEPVWGWSDSKKKAQLEAVRTDGSVLCSPIDPPYHHSWTAYALL